MPVKMTIKIIVCLTRGNQEKGRLRIIPPVIVCNRLPMALRCCLAICLLLIEVVNNLLHEIQELDVLAGMNTVERDR
jgi:hypothetical protein